MSQFLITLFEFNRKYKKSFILLICSLFIVAGYFASRIELEEDITKMMPQDKNFDRFNLVFQNSKFMDKLVVTVSLPDSDRTGGTEKLISCADGFVEKLQKSEAAELVGEISYRISDKAMFDVYHIFYDNLPIFLEEEDYLDLAKMTEEGAVKDAVKSAYRNLISPAGFAFKKFLKKDPLSMTPMALKKLQRMQVGENFDLVDGCIFTKDKKHLLLFVLPAYPSNETRHNSSLLAEIDNIIAGLEEEYQHDVSLQYYGGMAVAVGNAQVIKQDVILTVSIALVLIIGCISLYFRRRSIIFFIVLPVFFGGSVALALLYLFKGRISAISLGMGSILLGITIDYSLHLFSHYKHTGSVKKTLSDLGLPIGMSCLTTVSAFLCLTFVELRILHDLGLFAALSMISAAIFSLVVLPHLLKPSKHQKTATSLEEAEALSGHVKKMKYRYTLLPVFIFTLISLFTAGKVGFESDLSGMNYVSPELAAAEKQLNRISGGTMKSVYLAALGNDLDEAIGNGEQYTSTLKMLQDSGAVRSISSANSLLISRAKQQARIARWDRFWNGEKKKSLKRMLREEGKKYGFKADDFSQFYTFLSKDFQPVDITKYDAVRNTFLADWITEKQDFAMVTSILKVNDEKRDEVYEAFENSDDVFVLDKRRLTTRFVDLIKSDFQLLLNLSSLVVLCILILSTGRLELGFIMFLPMLISWLWTVGVMGIFDFKFNIFNIIISTFVFGLGIDYSIFIMRGLLQEYKTGQKKLKSYKISIMLSAFTTLVGVGVLIFAKHPSLKSMAVLSIIGILSVLLTCYLIEPFLMRLLVFKNREKGKAPVTLLNVIHTINSYSFFVGGSLFMSSLGTALISVLPFSRRKRKYLFHVAMKYVCKILVYANIHVRKRVINISGETFDKPAVIIANHQSFIDILVTLMLTPKAIILTKDWVWNSPFFGRIVRFADFYPVSSGAENSLVKMEQRVKEGYSIIVFPEGSRSADRKIKRFHKGAFFIAEKLNLDVIPLLIHGTGDCIGKGEFLLKSGCITLKILERIKASDSHFGEGYAARAKQISKHFKKEYEILRKGCETPEYFKDRLIKNYIYKGPVLEWYLRVKLRLEKNYLQFHELIPEDAVVTDVGCGYGFLSIMLSFLGEGRKITGIDYDEEKIATAAHCFAAGGNIRFKRGDIRTCEFTASDIFVLSDCLHYLAPEDQEKVISRCIEKLNPGGRIIIRDGDASLEKRHQGTKLTELFSTKIIGFNKTVDESKTLNFVTRSRIEETVKRHGLKVEVQDNSKLTSNIVYVVS